MKKRDQDKAKLLNTDRWNFKTREVAAECFSLSFESKKLCLSKDFQAYQLFMQQ